MNKYIAIALLFGMSIGAKAASTSFTLKAGGATNAPIALTNQSAKVNSVIITAPANNTTTVVFFDSQSKTQVYTIPAYTNILSYVTNYITTWTNYYGAANSVTNNYLVDVTNGFASALGTNNIPLVATVPTNSTVTFPNLNAIFQFGVWTTNTAGGDAIITLNYNQ